MDDLISRQAVIDQLHQSYNLLDAERRLEDMPSAEKTGKWMEKGGDAICPFCGFSCGDIYYLHEGNYCPDCGAKLEWEE